MREHRRLYWTASWLAIVLVAVKAFYLGRPAERTVHAMWDYVNDLTAVSFVDILYAAVLWIGGTSALMLAGQRPRLRFTISAVMDAVAAAS